MYSSHFGTQQPKFMIISANVNLKSMLQLLCILYKCSLRPSLVLDIFPQMPHEWLMLVIWFASMCLLTSKSSPSFPQTVQVNVLFRIPFFLVMKFPLSSIMDLICSSSWSDSAALSEIALSVSNLLGTSCSAMLTGCSFLWNVGGVLWEQISSSELFLASPDAQEVIVVSQWVSQWVSQS